MNGFSLVVVWVSMVGAFVSTIVSIRASFKFTTWAGSPFTRLALIASATMSAVYCLGYIWLLNHPQQGSEWSETLRPVGMISWVIGPWTAFPIALEYQMRKRARSMREQTAALLREVQGNGEDGHSGLSR